MNRKIAISAIMIAFVGGMIFAGTPVEAAQGGVGSLIDELWLAINALDGRVADNELDITALETATKVELYKVSSTFNPPSPHSVELNCESGDTVVSGYVIFPDGVTAQVNTVAINNGEGMLLVQSGATESSETTFQIICAKGGIEDLP